MVNQQDTDSLLVIEVLRETILSQKRDLRYKDYQIAYFTNQISQKEFDKIEDLYTIEIDSSIDVNLLLKKIEILIGVTGVLFRNADLSCIFNCGRDKIDVAIGILNKKVWGS